VPIIFAALLRGPHIKVAAEASRWQRMGDLIGSRYEPRTRDRRLTTSAIRLKNIIETKSKAY